MLEVHFDYLRKYKNVFDGRKVIYIAEGTIDRASVSKSWQEIFPGSKEVLVENDAKIGMAAHFVNMLQEMKGQPGYTFFCHSKGMTVVPERHRLATMKWVDVMYYNNLELLGNRIDDNCSVFFGALRVYNHGTRNWYYPGSFFWFNNKTLFKRNWNHCDFGNDVEQFPASISNFSETCCLSKDFDVVGDIIKYNAKVLSKDFLLDVETWQTVYPQRVELKDTTVIGVEGLVGDITKRTANAILHNFMEIDCEHKLFLTANKDDIKYRDFGIDVVLIAPLTYKSYSPFMLYELYKHIPTAKFITAQFDGWIVNRSSWLSINSVYDYIGAPFVLDNWKMPGAYFIKAYPECNTGNGGVSYRSKKLHELTKELRVSCGDWELETPYGDGCEDQVICLANRDLLINRGIKIANPYICSCFSSDGKPYCGSFAWHGKHAIGYPPNIIKYQ